MKLKERLESRIRGWLPKDPQAPCRQLNASGKPPSARTQVWIVAFVLGCVGGLLGAFASALELLGPFGSYVSVISIVIGLAVVAATAIGTKQKEEQERRQHMDGITRALKNRIRGWLPKEPALPRKYASGSPDEQKPKQPNRQSHYLRLMRLILGVFFVLIGIVHLFARQYELASLWFAGAIGVTIIAYFGWSVRPRTALGALLIALGGAMVFYNELAVIAFSSVTVFTWLLIDIVNVLAFWIVIGLLIGIGYAVWAFRKRGGFLRNSLSERRLLPYGVAALFIFLTYIAVVSGIQFAYAIPITFIISGALVLKGLRRFTVTIPALAVLLISMLVFGSAVAGTYAVTHVSEDRFLTNAEAPAADTLNLAVNSVGGDINLYFTDDDTQICHIAFVKEYGPISSSRGAEYHYQSYYDGEPATGFNYTIDNGEVNVTASSYTVLVNITVNQNLKLNFNLYTYFGDITVEAPPTVNSIQTMN